MLNELSNDPIQTAIAKMEKQHEEDKQGTEFLLEKYSVLFSLWVTSGEIVCVIIFEYLSNIKQKNVHWYYFGMGVRYDYRNTKGQSQNTPNRIKNDSIFFDLGKYLGY